ncbi:pleiotropic drug resistance 9 [Striga asiatica]|uniref:Pleiotropic drug resistance 9 n=1 Tax=Striga asiatica TaxID=4170 RepID=A0A5A7PAF7_STRAF|nr:pleiotropic drug resistance 9 [Striga asiatica]
MGFGGWDTGRRGSIRQCAVIILHEKGEPNERGRGEPLWSTNPHTALHVNRIEAGRKTLVSVIEDANVMIEDVNLMEMPFRGFCVVNGIGLQLREVGSWEPKPIIRANEKGQPIQRAVHVNQGATLRVVPVNIETNCRVRRSLMEPYLWAIILIHGVVAMPMGKGPHHLPVKPSHMKKLAGNGVVVVIKRHRRHGNHPWRMRVSEVPSLQTRIRILLHSIIIIIITLVVTFIKSISQTKEELLFGGIKAEEDRAVEEKAV